MNVDTDSTTIFDQLKQASTDEWHQYCCHNFVNSIGDGTLPIESFRYYLEQDYLFLIHFSRAWGLATYKSPNVTLMQWAAEILYTTLNVEMSLHVEFSNRFGVSQLDLENACESSDNLAYTRFVLDRGLSGDILDLYVALMPCIVGYAEIGDRLSLDYQHQLAQNPYREWIQMYSSEDYQKLATKSVSILDQLSASRGGMAPY